MKTFSLPAAIGAAPAACARRLRAAVDDTATHTR